MIEFQNEIGISKLSVDTPALILDLSVVENNIRTMVNYISSTGANLRPHVKTYRGMPALVEMQRSAGVAGFTCAKLSEAEVLAASGVKDILIANQIVGERKIARLVKLASCSDIKVAVDNVANIRELSAAATAASVTIGVLVEVNIGHNRCGVAPFEPALDMAREVVEMDGLNFLGLMGYDGHCTLKVNESERAKLSRAANALLLETKEFIESAGIPIEVVSASGTFTYQIAAEMEGITDIQAGTYLLMDTAVKDAGVREFDCAATVVSTVISRPVYPEANGLAIIDIGRKGISPILGMPEVKSPQGAQVFALSQEHCRVSLEGDSLNLDVGDKVELLVRDINGTLMLFDHIYAVRDDIIEAVWQIPLCGCST